MRERYSKVIESTALHKEYTYFYSPFFSGQFFVLWRIRSALIGFVSFSLIASAVYIINDVKDLEKDRIHPQKKNRPIASGRESVPFSILICMVLIIIAVILSSLFLKRMSTVFLFIYLILNIMYSCGLKNIPIIDIVILASGFVIRVLYGGYITDIEISEWLYLVIMCASLFMGLGKRRNELRQSKGTRAVLKYYTESFLDKNMYVWRW